MAKYFNRGIQFWKAKKNGDILLINKREKNDEYDGEGHIFLKEADFNQEGSIQITKKEFNKLRSSHLLRLKKF